MKKKYTYIILAGLVTITICLIVVGFLFNKTENEKQNGLTEFFDVSTKGKVAFVSYTDGSPEIFIMEDDQSQSKSVVSMTNEKVILDVAFSSDGSQLAFISSEKEKENENENLSSVVHLLNIETKKIQELFTEETLITELEFSTDDNLFYLSAGTFENYSPIASERPHDFDIHHYDFENKSNYKITNLKKYSMESLKVSADGSSVYVQMFDDADAETADDIFDAHQRIFQIPVDDPANLSVVSDKSRNEDIYDFSFVPGTNTIIYQSVAKTGSDGVFEYELFTYNQETNTEEQLTFLGEYVSNPVIGPENDTLYFIVDKQFAKEDSDYKLYRSDLDGENVTPISVFETKKE
ncbi:TolB-like translocation protein [Aquibacillus rhizosphaerae]|uniref:Uncharacterized protein n=1 Tax=Aquibacillus rhizosphaerae TaxID=3051431 RepID=A0ABT7L8E6_9BACI|nr:hypothetical protein [Aquibacillus sp. LR5S19]MDL4840865.1 hypothetical protein [Aquibacillus sp. LR5S19]